MTTKDKELKQAQQEKQYSFPYHYIPELDPRWGVRRHRALGWATEYICYQHYIKDLILSFHPDRILEIGCGDGFFIGNLDSVISERVGIDLSGRAIAFARAFHPDVTFHIGDASTLDEEFDVVVAIEVLEHIPDDDVISFIRTIFDRTKIGGKVVISVPSISIPVNKKHFRHYTLDLVHKQLRSANVPYLILKEEFVCRIPIWLEWYNKLTINRLWTIEFAFLSKWIWHRTWQYYRRATAINGRHLVVILEKIMPDF